MISPLSTLNSDNCCLSNFLPVPRVGTKLQLAVSTRRVPSNAAETSTPTVNASRVSAGTRCPPTPQSLRSVQSASWYGFLHFIAATSHFHFYLNLKEKYHLRNLYATGGDDGVLYAGLVRFLPHSRLREFAQPSSPQPQLPRGIPD